MSGLKSSMKSSGKILQLQTEYNEWIELISKLDEINNKLPIFLHGYNGHKLMEYRISI